MSTVRFRTGGFCVCFKLATDAKNGTLSKVGQICKLPGPVGRAVTHYRAAAQHHVETAAANMHTCDQVH